MSYCNLQLTQSHNIVGGDAWDEHLFSSMQIDVATGKASMTIAHTGLLSFGKLNPDLAKIGSYEVSTDFYFSGDPSETVSVQFVVEVRVTCDYHASQLKAPVLTATMGAVTNIYTVDLMNDTLTM